MPSHRIAAADLGAESGRVLVGTIADGRIATEVVHRFPNTPREIDGGLRWDLEALFSGIVEGLRRAAAGGPLHAIGIDTWGVDYVLVDAAGTPIEPAYHHRDKRTVGVSERVHARIAEAALYARNGVQALPFNTLYQLVAHLERDPSIAQRAERFLMVPDWLHWRLTGVMANERTDAGTTQLAVAGAAAWDLDLIAKLGLPTRWFGRIADPGTVLGPLRAELARDIGLATPPPVVLPAAHDTASAVAAVPGDLGTGCYVSSGTWSLIGVVTDRPALADRARTGGISNEIAWDGRIRLNRNIMGLWIVQELRRDLAAAGRERSYQELADLAAAAAVPAAPLDVDDVRFLHASLQGDSMAARVRGWCRERGLAEPADDGALVRLVLAGLADAYRRYVERLEALAGRRIEAIHVVGGGSQHRLLNRLTARACGRPVLAGPVEATALGNLLVQARGLGLLADEAAMRTVLGASAQVERFAPD